MPPVVVISRINIHIQVEVKYNSATDLLGVEVIIGQLQVVVITKLPEDSPRGFMPAPLDE